MSLPSQHHQILDRFNTGDSTQYITDKSYRSKMHVANWIAEILEYADTGDWQHIDGKMNPADMCTWGLMDLANLLWQDK